MGLHSFRAPLIGRSRGGAPANSRKITFVVQLLKDCTAFSSTVPTFIFADFEVDEEGLLVFFVNDMPCTGEIPPPYS